MQARGLVAEPVEFDVSEAEAWARNEGQRFDSAARAAYVATCRPNSNRG